MAVLACLCTCLFYALLFAQANVFHIVILSSLWCVHIALLSAFVFTGRKCQLFAAHCGMQQLFCSGSLSRPVLCSVAPPVISRYQWAYQEVVMPNSQQLQMHIWHIWTACKTVTHERQS